MSTQSIRNIIINQISSTVSRGREQIEEEGRKKIDELKSEIPSGHTEVIEKLKANINLNTCSKKGKAKFDKKLNNELKKLQQVEKPLMLSQNKITKINDYHRESTELMKINGYIVLLNKMCNVGVLRSYKLMSAWLEVLSNECSGIRDEELIKRLQEINRKYSNMRYGDYQVTQRYQISLTDEERLQMNKDRAQIQTVIGDDSQRMIVTMLKYPGDIHSKFLALFKSGNLHKAKIEQFVDKTIY